MVVWAGSGPVLCIQWAKVRLASTNWTESAFKTDRVLDLVQDGSKILSGGADKAVRMFELATQQATQVGAHDAPVSCLKIVEVSGQQVCLTGSWDKVSSSPRPKYQLLRAVR